MKTKGKILLAGICGLAIGISMTGYAISASAPGGYKVAVIDVQKVVSTSKQVQALKSEQQKKMEDLTKFVTDARKNLEKETDAKKKQALEEKYNKELLTKRDTIEKEYTDKLTKIDKDITAIITSNAKTDGYDLVLAKGVVLYGGTDITDSISKAVK